MVRIHEGFLTYKFCSQTWLAFSMYQLWNRCLVYNCQDIVFYCVRLLSRSLLFYMVAARMSPNTRHDYCRYFEEDLNVSTIHITSKEKTEYFKCTCFLCRARISFYAFQQKILSRIAFLLQTCSKFKIHTFFLERVIFRNGWFDS